MANYTGYIYSITNEINGKSYIGKTNDLVRRWKEHCYGKGNTSILNKAIKKYGLEHFVFDIVAQIPFDSVEELNDVLKQLEVYYIGIYDTFNGGYNATIGGDGISYYHHSEDTKKKMSESQKGRIFTEEHKAKCGLAFKGHHHTKEARESIRQALLNRSNALKKQIGDKLRGKKRDPQVIMKGAIKRRKPVLQYDIQGNFIKEFEGASFTGYEEANIIACCKSKLNSAYGFVWRYKQGDIIPTKIKTSTQVNIKNRPVLQFTKEGDFVAEYYCVNEAVEKANVNRSALSNCLSEQSKTCGGYMWKYKERKEVING